MKYFSRISWLALGLLGMLSSHVHAGHYPYSFILGPVDGPCSATSEPQGRLYTLREGAVGEFCDRLVRVREFLQSVDPGEDVYIDALSYGMGHGGQDLKPESFFQISINCVPDGQSGGHPKSGVWNTPNRDAASHIYEFGDPPFFDGQGVSATPGSHGSLVPGVAKIVANTEANVVGADLYHWSQASTIYFSINRRVTAPGIDFGPGDILEISAGSCDDLVTAGEVSVFKFATQLDMDLNPDDNLYGLEINSNGHQCCEGNPGPERIIWWSLEDRPGVIFERKGDNGEIRERDMPQIAGFSSAAIADGIMHDDPNLEKGACGVRVFPNEVIAALVDGEQDDALPAFDHEAPPLVDLEPGDDHVLTCYAWRDHWAKLEYLRAQMPGLPPVVEVELTDTTVSWDDSVYDSFEVRVTDSTGDVIFDDDGFTSSPLVLPMALSDPGVYTAEVHGNGVGGRSDPQYGRLEIPSVVRSIAIVSAEEHSPGVFTLRYYNPIPYGSVVLLFDGMPSSTPMDAAQGEHEFDLDTTDGMPEGLSTLSLVGSVGGELTYPSFVLGHLRPVGLTPSTPALEPRCHDSIGVEKPAGSTTAIPAGMITEVMIEPEPQDGFAGVIVDDLEFELVIDHPRIGDLRVVLEHPSGVEATLFLEPDNVGSRILRHVDDPGGRHDGWGTRAPMEGTELAVFNGLPADVEWVLRIENLAASGLSGELVDWKLMVCPELNFTFSVDDTTIVYDAGTGVGTSTTALSILEDGTNAEFPNEVNGFSMALQVNPDHLSVTNVSASAAVVPLDPQLFLWSFSPTGEVLIGAVLDVIPPAQLLSAATEVEVATLTLESGPSASLPTTTPIQFVDGMFGPTVPIDNLVGVGWSSYAATLTTGTISLVPAVAGIFRRGDANNDGSVNVADAVFCANALFVPGSPPPACADAADCNDDGLFNIADVVYTANYLFIMGSPAPPAPFPECGVDPTADGLDCPGFIGAGCL